MIESLDDAFVVKDFAVSGCHFEDGHRLRLMSLEEVVTDD